MLGKAFLSGLVDATEELSGHIEHCLVCRSCESNCPSGVKFGAFMDGLRSHLPAQTTQKDIAKILTDQEQRRALNKKLWLGQKSGLISIGKNILGDDNKRLLNSLPSLQRFQKLNNYYPAKETMHTTVMLFTGCNSELLGNALVLTAIELLTQLGVNVEIPTTQACCGGISRHQGDSDTAEQLETQNISAFGHNKNIPILTLASGCGASLLDYSDSLTESFTSRVMDINHFLVEHLQSTQISFKPLHKKVVIQTPCSMKNVMRQDKTVPTLLKMIPELELSHLKGQRGCCGAAGTYMYEHAETADALRKPILADLEKQQADILVTSNIGCAMHIQAGKPKMEVLHPIELLQQAMPD